MEQQGTLSLAVARGSAVPDDGLAIDLRRADIETALGSADDGLVELLLDLEAREVDGGATRRSTLAIGCTLADLERMLEDASDSVRVSFDAEALARAIDPDIEAHGLREKMAVLAVVVATTGAAAGGAQAMPTLGGQSGVSGGATVTSTGDTADGAVAAYAARNAPSEGAPASRANPSDAAAATIAQARMHSRRGLTPTEKRCRAAITWRRRWPPSPPGTCRLIRFGHHRCPRSGASRLARKPAPSTRPRSSSSAESRWRSSARPSGLQQPPAIPPGPPRAHDHDPGGDRIPGRHRATSTPTPSAAKV